MNITVVGTGYVGLVTGTCFAEKGNKVICVDIDTAKVEKMRKGQVPIYEPGLEDLFLKNSQNGNLSFTTQLSEAVEDAEIIFLALPTPPGEDGSADLSYILGVAKDLAGLIKNYKVIIDKSTVPVGTAERVHKVIAEKADPSLFDVVSNPEFLREGVAVKDFMEPDRVVIGTSSPKAKATMEALYAPFIEEGNSIFFMDERSAEMTKYAANSYLATRISFMNEIANLCEKLGANVDMVRKGIGSDSRIGPKFLYPGIGYGGSCFPKDVKALARTAQQNDYQFNILQAVMGVNTKQRVKLADRLIDFYGDQLKNMTIAMWGLAFKPNTDDIREAPSLYILERLIPTGLTIKAYDPEAMENVKNEIGDKIHFCKDQYEALEGADALVICTEWQQFREADLEKVKQKLVKPVIFDGRNIFDPQSMKDKGFIYSSIGR